MKPQHRGKNDKQQPEKQHETARLNKKCYYKWVEALTTVEKLVSRHTRVVHAFDASCVILQKFLIEFANFNTPELSFARLITVAWIPKASE